VRFGTEGVSARRTEARCRARSFHDVLPTVPPCSPQLPETAAVMCTKALPVDALRREPVPSSVGDGTLASGDIDLKTPARYRIKRPTGKRHQALAVRWPLTIWSRHRDPLLALKAKCWPFADPSSTDC
jgi:hypothetical protein